MKISRRKFIEIFGIGSFFYLFTPGLFSRVEGVPLRPPGALPENDFLLKCIRCFRCGQVCPSNAIQYGGWLNGQLAETPILANLRTNPCTLCMECTRVCPTGALNHIDPVLEDIRLTVKIGIAEIERRRCLVFNGRRRMCYLCLKVCPLGNEAIHVTPFGPMINRDICIGCGLCEAACPTAAITVWGIENE